MSKSHQRTSHPAVQDEVPPTVEERRLLAEELGLTDAELGLFVTSNRRQKRERAQWARTQRENPLAAL